MRHRASCFTIMDIIPVSQSELFSVEILPHLNTKFLRRLTPVKNLVCYPKEGPTLADIFTCSMPKVTEFMIVRLNSVIKNLCVKRPRKIAILESPKVLGIQPNDRTSNGEIKTNARYASSNSPNIRYS